MTRILTIETNPENQIAFNLDDITIIRGENKTSSRVWFKAASDFSAGVIVPKPFDEMLALWKGEKPDKKPGKGK